MASFGEDLRLARRLKPQTESEKQDFEHHVRDSVAPLMDYDPASLRAMAEEPQVDNFTAAASVAVGVVRSLEVFGNGAGEVEEGLIMRGAAMGAYAVLKAE